MWGQGFGSAEVFSVMGMLLLNSFFLEVAWAYITSQEEYTPFPAGARARGVFKEPTPDLLERRNISGWLFKNCRVRHVETRGRPKPALSRSRTGVFRGPNQVPVLNLLG